MRRTAALTLVASLLLPWTPTRPVEPWVVEGSSYRGPRGHGTHLVRCIPTDQAGRDYTDRDRWREIVVDREVSYDAEFGDPCPSGPVRFSTDELP